MSALAALLFVAANMLLMVRSHSLTSYYRYQKMSCMSRCIQKHCQCQKHHVFTSFDEVMRHCTGCDQCYAHCGIKEMRWKDGRFDAESNHGNRRIKTVDHDDDDATQEKRRLKINKRTKKDENGMPIRFLIKEFLMNRSLARK